MASQQQDLLQFVLTASRASLGDLYLVRLNEAANLEKQIMELIPRLADAKADALLTAFLRDHGEDLIAGGRPPLDIGPAVTTALARSPAREPLNAMPEPHPKAARCRGRKSA